MDPLDSLELGEESEFVGPDLAPDTSMGRSLATSLGTSLALQLMGTITGIVLARALGVQSRGELAAAVLWPQVVGTIATLGLQESVTFHVARAPRETGAVLGSSLVLWGVQSILFTGACAILVPIVLARHGESTIVSALIYLLYIPVNSAGVVFTAVLNGRERYAWFNIVRLAVGVSILLAQTLLLVTHELGVRSMVIGYVLCYIASTTLAGVLVWRSRPGRLRSTRQMRRSVFSYGLKSHASNTSSQINQRLDTLLISIFLSARDLGLYVVSIALTSMTIIVGGSIAYVALPSIARFEPGPERNLLARRLVSVTVVLSSLIALPVLLLAPQLVVLFFGDAFRPAATVTRVLVLAGVGFSASRALEAVLRAIDRPLDAGIAEVVALGATCVGLAVLLPTLGLLGAGLASLLAYLVSCAWMTVRAARALEIRWLHLLLPDRASLTLLASRLNALRRRGSGSR